MCAPRTLAPLCPCSTLVLLAPPPPPPRPGAATKLESQFRLTYSMILNLLRVEDLKASGAAGVCVWGEECVWGGGC